MVKDTTLRHKPLRAANTSLTKNERPNL